MAKKTTRPVKIGKHVWIGTGAIIMPGIIVGDYAVVGAGSVVTSHIPSKAIVVGNPARIIKMRDSVNFSSNNNDFLEKNMISRAEGFVDRNKVCKFYSNLQENKI